MHFISRTLLAAALILTPALLVGQVSTATISGTLTDTTGALIPHVSVQARNQSTGTIVKTESNESGQYSLPLLPPGTYTINVQSGGFRKYEQQNLTLSSGDHPTIDIPLTVGEVGQVVEVTATPPLLGSEDANIGQVIPGELLENIPLSGRTPMRRRPVHGRRHRHHQPGRSSPL